MSDQFPQAPRGGISKGMTGAWMSVAGSVAVALGASGLLPLGISIDPDTRTLMIPLDGIINGVLVGLFPVGGVLAWVGRKFATKRIGGLF